MTAINASWIEKPAAPLASLRVQHTCQQQEEQTIEFARHVAEGFLVVETEIQERSRLIETAGLEEFLYEKNGTKGVEFECKILGVSLISPLLLRQLAV